VISEAELGVKRYGEAMQQTIQQVLIIRMNLKTMGLAGIKLSHPILSFYHHTQLLSLLLLIPIKRNF